MSNTNATRLIRGTILRCTDGKWSDTLGGDPPPLLIALGTTQALQCWKDSKPTDVVMAEKGKPLPDVDELNSQIPESEWEKGLDGKPKAPWVLQHVAYFIDPVSAESYTFINGTFGARLAVEKLQDRVANMQRLRGNALPVVKLESKPMKTKFGTKQRPEFTVVEWREIGTNGGEVKAIEHKAVGKPVAQPTVGEELNDEIPPWV
jgi:hypothetical protein